MAKHIDDFRIPLKIPDFRHSLIVTYRDMRSRLVPSYTRDGAWVDIAKSHNFVVVSVPHVQRRVQGH